MIWRESGETARQFLWKNYKKMIKRLTAFQPEKRRRVVSFFYSTHKTKYTNHFSKNPQIKIIGITGSYGKTSMKYYLNTLLKDFYDVLITPGNFNTTLGVVRTIREHLKPSNQIFLCEMGARHVHDIKEICDLFPPQEGIITSIGPQHLETFHTQENIVNTKFELADADVRNDSMNYSFWGKTKKKRLVVAYAGGFKAFGGYNTVEINAKSTTNVKPHISSTRWRSVSDQKNKIYYFESVMTPNLFWLDLKKIDFSPKAGIKKLTLTNGKIYAGDAVKDLKDSDSFVFLFQTPVM